MGMECLLRAFAPELAGKSLTQVGGDVGGDVLIGMTMPWSDGAILAGH